VTCACEFGELISVLSSVVPGPLLSPLQTQGASWGGGLEGDGPPLAPTLPLPGSVSPYDPNGSRGSLPGRRHALSVHSYHDDSPLVARSSAASVSPQPLSSAREPDSQPPALGPTPEPLAAVRVVDGVGIPDLHALSTDFSGNLPRAQAMVRPWLPVPFGLSRCLLVG
jgi:hypothetical protein